MSDPPRDELRALDELRSDPQNRRAHPDRNVEMVADALRAVGAARSIVIDEDDVILAGNGVTQAAVDAGIQHVRVIESDGTELIAVRRRGLTPEQKRALALFDNRTAELAEWNVDQLSADHDAGLDMQAFWTPDEEAALLNITPGFEPVSADEQGRLDQQQPITCPQCGHAFIPKR